MTLAHRREAAGSGAGWKEPALRSPGAADHEHLMAEHLMGSSRKARWKHEGCSSAAWRNAGRVPRRVLSSGVKSIYERLQGSALMVRPGDIQGKSTFRNQSLMREADVPAVIRQSKNPNFSFAQIRH